MWIDIVLLILVIVGIVRGWQHGFIISVFITAAWILGIVGALKLCSVAATAMRDHFNWNNQYLPVIAFIIIFLLIAFVIYVLGKSLEKVIEVAQLGFINKMLGILLRVSVLILVFSLFIWLINQAQMISPETKTQSKTFHYLDQTANVSIHLVDQYLPALKNIFGDIEKFFEELSKQADKVV
jgi:membrane protein required for colicin V production